MFALCRVAVTDGRRQEGMESINKTVTLAAALVVLLAGTVAADEERADPAANDAHAESRYDVSLEGAIEDYLSSEAAAPAQKPNTLEVFWKEGLRFETADGSFKLRIGGRLMIDMWAIDADDELKAIAGDPDIGQDRIFIRRARLGAQGTIYGKTEYKLEVDFARVNLVALQDAYIGLKKVLAGDWLRVGHLKAPSGLETLTSSRYITFMERATAVQAFALDRFLGVSWKGSYGEIEAQKRFTVSLSFGRPTIPGFAEFLGEDGATFVGRVTMLALYQENEQGPTLLHLGVNLQLRFPDAGTVQFRARPNVGRGTRVLDTGPIPADQATVVGFEIAFNHGSWSAQGEFFLAMVDALDGSSPAFSGWYVQVSYWLTGEHRPYNSSNAVFDRVKPQHNYGQEDGKGAWEVAVRVDSSDLDDGAVMGNKGLTYYFGVNWHLNPNQRIMFNRVFSDIEAQGFGDCSATG
ncbi:MAG: porin, partial [Planctomycetota bacterium]|nr:porin [Planctomycetota bacterium]